MTTLKNKTICDTVCFLLGLRPQKGIVFDMLVELVFQDVRYDFPRLARQEVIDQIHWLKTQHIIRGILRKDRMIRLANKHIGKELNYEQTQ